MTNAEAIEMIQNDMKLHHDYLSGEYRKALKKAIKALEAQEWIPRKEWLPKKDGSYLVSGKWASGKGAVGECEYSRNDGYFKTSWNFDVLAWKPLPEPYKEEVKHDEC